MKSGLLSSISGLDHEFGDRVNPEPLLGPGVLPKWKQVHGTAICEVAGVGQDCGEVDGMVGGVGLTLGIRTADCVPILLARRDGSQVATLHAGWRGTIAGIVRAFGRELLRRNDAPSQWVAAIGPSIRPCCYEVSPEIAAQIAAIEVTAVEGRRVDLVRANESLLRQMGVAEIELVAPCTGCTLSKKKQPNSSIF